MAKNTEVADIKAAEPVFPLSKLRDHCAFLFKISSAEFDAVTHGLSADAEFTKKEISERIKAWRGKEAK